MTIPEAASNFTVLLIRVTYVGGYQRSFTVMASGGESVTVEYLDHYAYVNVSGTKVSLDTTANFKIFKVMGIK